MYSSPKSGLHHGSILSVRRLKFSVFEFLHEPQIGLDPIAER